MTRSPGRAGDAPAKGTQQPPIVSRLKEIRAWSVALAFLAVAFVALYIYALTHPTGNTPLWMPLIFAGMVFVTGLAMLLAAKPPTHWSLEPGTGEPARTRSAGGSRGAPPPERENSFLPDEDEPVRFGVNSG